MIADQVIAEWRLCRDWILPALIENTEADLLRELMAGRAQLWRGDRCAMVTQLVSQPEPYALLWLAGGDIKELLSLAPGMVAWGRAHGARAARINGRPGWARALRHLGFVADGGDLRKAI